MKKKGNIHKMKNLESNEKNAEECIGILIQTAWQQRKLYFCVNKIRDFSVKIQQNLQCFCKFSAKTDVSGKI